MEQLIIFLLIAVGSAISGYLQKKRKQEAERDGETAVPGWPATGRDWQDELRRMLQGENPPVQPPAPPKLPSPPPVTGRVTPARPVAPEASEAALVPAFVLKESGAAYARAANLQTRVEKRLQAADAQTARHTKPQTARARITPANRVVRRWTRNRESLREAFIASLIFSPPVALAEPREPA